MMPAATLSPATLDAGLIADLAVTALRAEADLTPKPGLVDGRGSGAHADMTQATLHDSAEALRTAFAECASAAVELPLGVELRARIGRIGRRGEGHMLAATGGVNTHRGALWALGLLSAGAGAGVARGGGLEEAIRFAATLAAIPDPGLVGAIRTRTSHGARAWRRFGARGAVGEAQDGFPHVMRYALPTLQRARLSGSSEDTARLDALLALIAHLDDTCILHRGGHRGLREVQSRAHAVLHAGGSRTPSGRALFADLDQFCAEHRLSPGGSGDLLAATLFLDSLDERTPESCKP